MVQTISNTNTMTACIVAECGPIESVPLFNIAEAKRVIADSISYTSDSLQYRWWARHNLYIGLLAQDSLVANDSLIGAFFNEYNHSNIVYLDSLRWAVYTYSLKNFEDNKEMETQEYNNLMYAINNVTTENTIEINMKNYSKRILQLTQNPENREDILNAISNIAEQCVFYGGPTVLEARAYSLLNNNFFDVFDTNFEDSCLVPQFRLARFIEEDKREDKLMAKKDVNIDYTLYPNLFNGEGYANITLGEKENGIVRLYTVDGKISYEYKVIPGRNKLNIGLASLEGGVYIYRVFTENELRHTGKLVSVK